MTCVCVHSCLCTWVSESTNEALIILALVSLYILNGVIYHHSVIRLCLYLTHQVLHVSAGEHVGPHVGVLVQQCVKEQGGLVGALLLTQGCVQAVEVDLEAVGLL